MTVKVQFLDGEGRTVRVLDAQRAAGVADRVGGSGFAAELALDDVPPGSYVVRVEARAGANGASVRREIPVAVR